MNRALSSFLLLAAAASAQDYGDTVRMKIETNGGTYKGGLFIPSGAKKNEVFPLVIAIPGDKDAKAFIELGPWQQPAYDKRFAVFSVDCKTATQRGWHPSELVEMRHDMEAIENGLKQCLELMKERGAAIDETAIFMTGWSGGSYLTMWLGTRRSHRFLGLCCRAPLWFKETVKVSKHDTFEIDPSTRILLYRGENDHSRSKKETDIARKMLLEAGFRHVKTEIIADMGHEMKIEPFLGWFQSVLKETGKARREGRKIASEVAKLKTMIEQKKAGAYGKLAKLAERERKLGANGGAQELLGEITAAAGKQLAEADGMAKAEQFEDAVKLYKQIEKTYSGLDVAKQARKNRGATLRGDAYKASEMLAKAKNLIDKGVREKGFDLLEKIVDKYPATGAAAEAKALLRG